LCLNCCGGVVLYCTNNKMLQLMWKTDSSSSLLEVWLT
jgi:hypothetical protein